MASGDSESPSKEKLQREKASLQSAFTKTEQKVRRILQGKEASIDTVDNLLISIGKTFVKLNKKVEELLSLSQDDDVEVEILSEYLNDMKQRFESLRAESEEWKHDQLKIEDSVRQASSSSLSRIAAKKASILMKAETLKKQKELEMKQLELDHMKESLELETELESARADEELLTRRHSVKTDDDFKREIFNVFHLPKVEIMKFDGNPIKYWSFIRSFDETIDIADISNSAKLNRLLYYCVGPARELVECFMAMDPEEGYLRARNLLRQRFGNEYVTAKAWIDKVTDAPPIRSNDAIELRKFADTIRSCVVSLNAMGRISEIDNQLRMRKIVSRLPFHLQGKWRHEAVLTVKASGSYPDIEQLAEFIEIIAEELNDPVFGVECLNAASQKSNNSNRPKPFLGKHNVSNFSVQTNKPSTKFTRSCRCCSGDHHLYKCEKFRKMESQERRNFVARHGLCFNCFASGHRSYNCPKESNCDKCNKKHSNWLHSAQPMHNLPLIPPGSQAQVLSKTVKTDDTCQGVVSFQMSARPDQSIIALPIVPVTVKSTSGDVIKSLALLDHGSTNTFVASELIDKLKISGTLTTLSLNTLTSREHLSHNMIVDLEVADLEQKQLVNMTNVIVVDKLPCLQKNVISKGDVQRWPHLIGIDLPNLQDAKVQILIGQDNPLILTPLEVRHGEEKSPFAMRTMFGWTINGPVFSQPLVKDVNVLCTQTDNDLNTQVKRFWELENPEVCSNKLQMSVDDRSVLNLWDKSTSKEKGHYKLPIPFKAKDPKVPNNFSLAASRLDNLGRKLSKNDEMLTKYSSGIQELLDLGFAEKVPLDEENNPDLIWYIPHHVVLNEKKPDKFRIVFDCSARFGNVSLNSEVLQGPDLTNSLMGVLLKFREGEIAVAGDIEHMYLQVKVSDKHRDALRFLWWEQGNPTKPPEIYRMTSHLFGGVWSASVANYAVRRTANDNEENFDSDTIQSVRDNFYVDDFLKAVSSEEEAISLISSVTELLHKGGFNLHKWISNSRKVIDSVPVAKRAKAIREVDLYSDVLPHEKALGVKWNVESDEFGFQVKSKDKPLTKRGVISVISSVFDPFGFVSPVILEGKKIFQNECRLQKSWDAPLETGNAEKWLLWLSNLHMIENFKIPRCVVPQDFGTIASAQIHHFSDASLSGYGVVSYLRLQNDSGQIHCSFLLSKSRLAPIKTLTIPRLELSAALLGAQVDHMLCKELQLPIDCSTFWTDSMTVLHYIKSNTLRYQTFVANRVAQIHELSNAVDWRYVESNLNPADDVSRGLDATKIIEQDSWIHGPEFLWQSPDYWPQLPDVINVSEEQLEIKRVSVNTVKTESVDVEGCTDKLLQKYSSLYRLKRAVSWILRLKSCLRKRIKESESKSVISLEPLQVEEMKIAEFAVVRYVQMCAFSDELSCLRLNKSVKRSSPIYSLDPVLDSSGLLCVGGRLRKAPIPDSIKHQLILPKQHHVCTLLVREIHENLGHQGKEHVLSELRQKYWIVSARQFVKRVLARCVLCKRLHGRLSGQKMSDLPEDRVTPGKPPFSHVGVDCFGPIIVKRGRSDVKRYGCLFTCLCTRAIHIEKLDTMDTSSFISALRRFESRRGTPDLIRSDNGSNFRGAQRELSDAIKIWNKSQIQDYMLQKEIKWIFNAPTASHMGGVWERQIRTVRKILNSLLYKQQGLHDEELSTLFCEIERIVNSRPITIVSSNPDDKEPLTPNHILLLRSNSPMPPGHFSVHDVYQRRWKHVQFLANQFWKRWLHEYLPTLQLRHKWSNPVSNFNEGDIVLVCDEQSPRNMWPLARILKTFPGRDGLVRSVQLRLRDSVLTRPVHKLCLIESCHM